VFLHRAVAERTVQAETGIGADRLVLSATHTHSGPGNFFAAEGLNANAGRFRGFDSLVAEFIIDGISGAIEDAANDMKPAKAGWRMEPVWDFTFNRSYEAFEKNSTHRIPVDPNGDRPLDQQAVDSTFALLRVDRCEEGWTNCRPWGGYGVFAIHASNIPASNNLFDADTHGVIARTVEDHIRGERGRAGGSALFLLSQGALGDISANLRDPTPCRLYSFLPELGSAGPKTLPQPEAWLAPPDELEACLDRVRRETDSLALALGERVEGLFDRAGDELSETLSMERAFATIDLTEYEGPHPICWPPRVGAGSVGGAERGYIRTWKHRPLFINMNFDEGGSAARDTPKGCFGHKKTQLGFLVKDHTLPQLFQLGVYRVGNVLLGAVPVEPTTEVGAFLRETLLQEGPDSTERALIVSLTNGYGLYVASPEEYEAQHYEGGSTIYGPNSAPMLGYELGRLASSLNDDQPTVRVGPAKAFGPKATSHFWDPRPVEPGFERKVVDATCTDREVKLRWTDERPGTLIPARGPILELERLEGGLWVTTTDDGSPEIEIRALEPAGSGFVWEGRWVPRTPRDGSYRFRILSRSGHPSLSGPSCEVSSPRSPSSSG
jgi:neutral ceramidase